MATKTLNFLRNFTLINTQNWRWDRYFLEDSAFQMDARGDRAGEGFVFNDCVSRDLSANNLNVPPC